MRFTDQEIRKHIEDWVKASDQREVRFLLHYCLGYYGYITNQIMRVIDQMVNDDMLTWGDRYGR